MEEQEERYKIISATAPQVLSKKVNLLIEEGYQPIGNIIFAKGRFVQALFKQDMSMLENLTKQFGGL